MSKNDDNCPFCKLARERVLNSGGLAISFRDAFPVTELHTLVIPKRHLASYFDMSEEERRSIHELLELHRAEILAADPRVEGFNIGWNCGEVAGQTVFHCHVHLIPRRRGDVHDPRGGVRGVIPSRRKYLPEHRLAK